MPVRTEVSGNGAIGGEELLGLPRGLEPLHASLALTRGLVGNLRTIVQIPMLSMFYTREDLSLGGPVALEFICDDDTRGIS